MAEDKKSTVEKVETKKEDVNVEIKDQKDSQDFKNQKTDTKKTSDKKEIKAEKKEATEKKKKRQTRNNQATLVDKSEIKPGMTIRVYQKIKELNIKGEEKERVQYFEGIVIARKHGNEIGATITVRKISDGIGVEKIFPLNLPTIEKIEIKKRAKVRRAKLYFLKRGYKKRLKEKVV